MNCRPVFIIIFAAVLVLCHAAESNGQTTQPTIGEELRVASGRAVDLIEAQHSQLLIKNEALNAATAEVSRLAGEVTQLKARVEVLTAGPAPTTTPAPPPVVVYNKIVRQGESLSAAFADNVSILVEGRHVVTNTIGIRRTNMKLVGAPGSAIVKGAGGDSRIFSIDRRSTGIVFEGLNFESETPGHGIGISVSGIDITVRNCTVKGLKEFVKLDQMNPPTKVAIVGNKTDTSTYAVYMGGGDDILIEKNWMVGGQDEHIVRGNGTNIRILSNYFARRGDPGATKNNLALQRVDGVLVKGNTFVTFTAGVGPETSLPDQRAKNVRFEGNVFENALLEINEGSNDIVATGNQFSSRGVRFRTSGGTNGGVNRVQIINNTSPLDESKLVTIDDRNMGEGWVRGLVVQGNVKR